MAISEIPSRQDPHGSVKMDSKVLTQGQGSRVGRRLIGPEVCCNVSEEEGKSIDEWCLCVLHW